MTPTSTMGSPYRGGSRRSSIMKDFTSSLRLKHQNSGAVNFLQEESSIHSAVSTAEKASDRPIKM